jgi:hypothetical protein
MARKQNNDPADFWREYEKTCGEKVLAYTLGQYISGWDEYEYPFWGLLIATGGGFRVHHFPHESWIQALSRTTMGGEAPKEKTIFIPKERLVSAELRVERSWWKKLLFAAPPRLIIRYRKVEGEEAELVALTENKAEFIVKELGVGKPGETPGTL